MLKVAKFGGSSVAGPEQFQKVKAIIDAFMERPRKTLVMVSHYESELPSCIERRLILERHC